MNQTNFFNTILFLKNTEEHPFHLVNSSLWPIALAFSLYNFLISIVEYFNYFIQPSLTYENGSWKITFYSPVFYFCIFLFFFSKWLIDIIREATFEGYHTLAVQKGIYFGMLLFILSEIMFFFSFFWGYFHVSWSPNIYINTVWPPALEHSENSNFDFTNENYNIEEEPVLDLIEPRDIPLYNSCLLIASGFTVTYAHEGLLTGCRYTCLDGLYWTVIYGFLFSFIQLYEYSYCDFSINDGVYGSIFFLLTGFHGIHVLIGALFLSVCLFRHINYHFTRQHHVGLELAVLYWHLVDAIWIALMFIIYEF